MRYLFLLFCCRRIKQKHCDSVAPTRDLTKWIFSHQLFLTVKALTCNYFESHDYYVLGTIIKKLLSYGTKFYLFSQFKAVTFACKVFAMNKFYYTLSSLYWNLIKNVGRLSWTKAKPDLNLPTVLLSIFRLFSYAIPRNRFSILLYSSCFLALLPNCLMAWPVCYLEHKPWQTLGS